MIGAFRHRISLQQETEVSDGGGGYALGWTTSATVWAKIQPLSGSEQLRAMQLESSISHRIRIRYRSDVQPDGKWRVLYGTRTFNIKATINEDERSRFLVLLCEEGVAT